MSSAKILYKTQYSSRQTVGCSDFVTFTTLGIFMSFGYRRDCKWEFKIKYNVTFHVVFAVVVENMVWTNSGTSWWSTTSWLSPSAPSTAARLSWASDTVRFFGFTESSCSSFLPTIQGDTRRCRLSWLTSSALVYEPKCGGGGSCGVSANAYSCVHHVTCSPK